MAGFKIDMSIILKDNDNPECTGHPIKKGTPGIMALALFVGVTSAAWAEFPEGWSRSCALTVQYGQVAANLADFPVLVGYNATSNSETNLPDEMMQTGNSNAAQANGGDIRFTLDAAGTIPLHYEIVTFTQNATLASARAEIWVKLPALSASANTTFYVWYHASPAQAAPAANDPHWGSQGTWDDGYKGVWHFPNGTILAANDSTNNIIDGTLYNVSASSGQVDGDGSFNGSSSYIYLNDPSVLKPARLTLTAWFKTGADGIIARKRLYGYWLRIGSGTCQFALYEDNNSQVFVQSVSTCADGLWHYAAGVYDGSTVKVYVDGGTPASTNTAATNLIYYQGGGIAVGRDGDSSNSYFTGDIDEVRISAVARSAGWITTEYNNQHAPQSFIVRGTAGAAGSPKRLSGGVMITGVSSITP